MLYDFPTIIVDRFFKDPQSVRDLGLSLEFKKSEIARFSGKRTDSLHLTHPTFFRDVCNKIFNCYSLPVADFDASLHFHITGEEFGQSGWVHTDNAPEAGPGFATLIYLGPQDGEFGTTLYRLSNLNYDQNDKSVEILRQTFMTGVDCISEKEKYNSRYMETIKINNVFNRMISYDNRHPHAAAGYYGNTKNSMRLTLLAFFYQVKTEYNNYPLKRADLLSAI